ncbi:MAG: hypothetical protein E7057_08365 [Lentisphaerae bacterium]|nr:hypothetical protein [Lentisphaerota bacterium]
MLTRKKILLLTAAAALLARLVFALTFSTSCFASYHTVSGLDMQTLLRFSEWGGGANHAPFFTMHRLLIYLDWLIGRGNHHPSVIFAVQAILGTAAALCAADLTLKFSRSRKAALVCGIFFPLYLPFLVYEFSILQESFMVYFALFAFWATVNGIRKRFNCSSSIIFTAAFSASLAGRPAALFMCGALIIFAGYQMWKRRLLKRFAAPAAALIAVLVAFTAFNGHFSGIYSPFYNVLPYTMQFNAQAAAKESSSTAHAPEKSLLQSAMSAAKRVPVLFKHGELPENHNIYFWCEKLPELNCLPSPGLIIPLACAGVMVIIFSGAWKRRYGLLLLPLLTMALPLCARDPIGRYRLMLVPYFFIIIPCAAVIFIHLKTAVRRGAALFGAALGAFFSIHDGDVPLRIRPSDYSAWAMALENTPGTDTADIVKAYGDYWQATGCSSERAFCMTTDKALQYNDLDTAFTIIAQAAEKNLPSDLIHYYLAWCFAMQNQPFAVQDQLSLIKNPQQLSPFMYEKYIMLSNDTRRILNNLQK